MRRYFHGAGKSGPYFEGWYFKSQTKDGRSIALIPAFHIDSGNRRSASVQVITDSGAWWVEYPEKEFAASQQQFFIRVGSNVFSEAGMSVQIEQPGLSLHGKLRFGTFLPLKSDIMGPFRFLTKMECSHGVTSMAHSLQGQLTLNGVVFDFAGGTGYIETDRGRAFPDAYLWTQCSWSCGSLMLSVATIPLAKINFTGCICALIYNGKEYRMATYQGVKVEEWSDRGAVICQRRYRLEVEVLKKQSQPLRAPVNGAMGRTIHESLCSELRYRFWIGDKLLFDRIDCNGSFEYSKAKADKHNRA